MIAKEVLEEYEKAKKENHLWWLKSLLKQKSVILWLGIVAIFLIAGIFGPLLAPYDPLATCIEANYQGPSWAHWFGTDSLGRDYFSRNLVAIQTSLIIAGVTVLFGGFYIANSLGLTSGYYGGWKDWIIMRLGELFSMLPGFFMIIFIVAAVKPRYVEFLLQSLGDVGHWLMDFGVLDFSFIFIVMSLFFWVGTARAIRSQVLSVRESLFIDAARISGASSFRIILHHLVPNTSHILILELGNLLVIAIGAEIGLSFLGLGITSPHPSFGLMFSACQTPGTLEMHPYLLLFPGVIVITIIFAFKRLADNLIRVTESR